MRAKGAQKFFGRIVNRKVTFFNNAPESIPFVVHQRHLKLRILMRVEGARKIFGRIVNSKVTFFNNAPEAICAPKARKNFGSVFREIALKYNNFGSGCLPCFKPQKGRSHLLLSVRKFQAYVMSIMSHNGAQFVAHAWQYKISDTVPRLTAFYNLWGCSNFMHISQMRRNDCGTQTNMLHIL